MSEASIDASQNMNLKEEISIEINYIEEFDLETDTDAGSNLSEKDKKRREWMSYPRHIN